MQQASMKGTVTYYWRGLMSTSMRHMVKDMLNCSLKHFVKKKNIIYLLWTGYGQVGEVCQIVLESLLFSLGKSWSLSQLHRGQLIAGTDVRLATLLKGTMVEH